MYALDYFSQNELETYIQETYITPILNGKTSEDCLELFKKLLPKFFVDKLRFAFDFMQDQKQWNEMQSPDFWEKVIANIERIMPKISGDQDVQDSVYIFLAAQKAFAESLGNIQPERSKQLFFSPSPELTVVLRLLAQTEIVGELSFLVLLNLSACSFSFEIAAKIEQIFMRYSYHYHQAVVLFLKMTDPKYVCLNTAS